MATLLEVVAGDMADMPFWPGRVTVTEVRPSDDGMSARVFWTAQEGQGVTWLTEAALVRVAWDFRSQSTAAAFRPERPCPVRDAVAAMTQAQSEAGIGSAPGMEG